MQTTMIKTIDDLGRIVLPKPFRRALNLVDHSEVIISMDNGVIHIKSAQRTCALCGKIVTPDAAFGLCSDCLAEIKKSDIIENTI